MFLSTPERAEFYRFLELLYNRVGRFSSRNGGKAFHEVPGLFVHPAQNLVILPQFSMQYDRYFTNF